MFLEVKISTVCVIVTEKPFSTNDHSVHILEIQYTFRGHHWRVEEENTPRNLEIAFVLKDFQWDCAQETGVGPKNGC